ncbi:unnamed protein product [Cyclocybe aegerita]|uniref:Thioredoxin domain-containing protein n=1 Tax=Cyclocybe aegerita TaxID=1973307 RepID=A0A8S0XIX3_CYCAE|nr:unnamed protein product [Cyclocybe aegerita]
MAVVRLTGVDQLNDLAAQNAFTVVFVHRKGCWPCTMMHPVFEHVVADRKRFGGIGFGTVDASSGLEGCHLILEEYNINGFPHLLLFREVELFSEVSGYVDLKLLEDILSFSVNFNSRSFNAQFTLSVPAGEPASEPEPDTCNNSENQGTSVIQVHEGWRDPDSVDQLLNYNDTTILVFCSSDAPYVSHLPSYFCRHEALLRKHNAVIHIIKIIGPFNDEAESYFQHKLLKYKPFAKMLRSNFLLSQHSFRLDANMGFGEWLTTGLEASKVIDTAPEVHEPALTDIYDMKEFRKQTAALFKPVVVLLYDNSAASKAMYWIFWAASADSEFKSYSFFALNYIETKDAETKLDLHQGTVVAVYRRSAAIAEKRFLMPFNDLKEFLLRALVKSPSPHPSRVSVTQDDSFLSAIYRPFSRPGSVLSSHSQGSRLSAPKLHRSRSTSSLRGKPNQCRGNYQPREERGFFQRLVASTDFFQDPEYNCVVPAEVAREGIQLGRANEGGSYFGITLRPQTFETHLKLSFAVQFGPDRTEKARFVSSYLSFTFGYNDANGREHSLKIKDIFPKDYKGDPTVVHTDNSLGGGMALSIGAGAVASITTEGKGSRDTHFSRVTAPRVRGSGQYSDTATWTFEEDDGEAGRHGLDSEYVLEATLGGASIVLQDIWLRFWGKAVLVLGGGHKPGSKQTLQIGSRENPFRRVLDLSRHVCYVLEDEEGSRSIVSAP